MWAEEQIEEIHTGNDFHVAPYREDGRTPGTPVWVWAATLDGLIFVRTGNPASRWFAAAIEQGAGDVRLGDASVPVVFAHITEDVLLDRIDAAFVAKYAEDPYFSTEVLQRSRARVLAISPR